jgi:hypothetical protein
MGLVREIKEISRNQTRLLEKEEKQHFEVEFEKDIINCLRTNIEQATFEYGTNDVWFKQEEIIINTIEDLKHITIKKNDMKQEQDSLEDVIVNEPKYNINELEEYQISTILEDMFVKEVKKYLQLLNLQEKASLNNLVDVLEEDIENTYLYLRQEKYLKKDIVRVLKGNRQLNLRIKQFNDDYDVSTIKKAFEKATNKVLNKYSYDVDVKENTIKSKIKNVPLAYKSLAFSFLLDKCASAWAKPNKYSLR